MVEYAGVNASPLIVLSRAGHLDLLKLAARCISVPRPVADEIRRRPSDDPTVRALASASWLEVVEPPPIPASIASRELGSGESSLLAWAHARQNVIVILDDAAARRCAVALGLVVRGTLSLVVDAKQQGVISSAAPLIEDIRRAGLYVSQRLVRSVLASVGEG